MWVKVTIEQTKPNAQLKEEVIARQKQAEEHEAETLAKLQVVSSLFKPIY